MVGGVKRSRGRLGGRDANGENVRERAANLLGLGFLDWAWMGDGWGTGGEGARVSGSGNWGERLNADGRGCPRMGRRSFGPGFRGEGPEAPGYLAWVLGVGASV